MRRFTQVTIEGEEVLLQNTIQNTLMSGEDQENDVIVIEEQHGYDIFDKSLETVDQPLGVTGASGDLLARVRVTTVLAGGPLDIYDGDVATGTLVLSIPNLTTVGTSYECGFTSINSGFTGDDDANTGAIIAIGRFT